MGISHVKDLKAIFCFKHLRFPLPVDAPEMDPFKARWLMEELSHGQVAEAADVVVFVTFLSSEVVVPVVLALETITGWWFQIFFIFIPIWGRFPF